MVLELSGSRSIRGGGRRVGRLEVRGFGSAFDQPHRVPDGLNHRSVSHRSIEHEVIEGARGPVGVEIVFYVSHALAIDRIAPFDGILFAVAISQDAPDFFGSRSVKKNMERAGILAQEIRRAATNHASLPG